MDGCKGCRISSKAHRRVPNIGYGGVEHLGFESHVDFTQLPLHPPHETRCKQHIHSINPYGPSKDLQLHVQRTWCKTARAMR